MWADACPCFVGRFHGRCQGAHLSVIIGFTIANASDPIPVPGLKKWQPIWCEVETANFLNGTDSVDSVASISVAMKIGAEGLPLEQAARFVKD